MSSYFDLERRKSNESTSVTKFEVLMAVKMLILDLGYNAVKSCRSLPMFLVKT
jgi:hypothetical protein